MLVTDYGKGRGCPSPNLGNLKGIGEANGWDGG